MTENTDNSKALVREIMEMARRDSAGAVAAAEAGAASLLAAASEKAESEGRAAVEAARAAAAQRSLMLLAALPLETERFRAARLESLLVSIKEKAAARLEEGMSAGDSAVYAGLAAEALRGMEGNSFLLTLPPGAPGSLVSEAKRLSGKDGAEVALTEDRALAGGVIARDTAGRQYWDNSFRARLERFWPELRSRLAAGLPGGKKNEQA